MKACCDWCGVCVIIQSVAGVMEVKAVDVSEDSSFTLCDFCQLMGREGGVDRSSVFENGANESVVSV